MNLSKYTIYWFNTYRKARQRPTTQITSQSIINTHIVNSTLGEMNISDITTEDIQEFLVHLLLHGNRCKIKSMNKEGSPLSHNTVNKVRQILIAVFESAIRDKLISLNPAKYTFAISEEWSDKPVFTVEMQKKFLEAAKNKKYYIAYIILFFSGIRRSELLGLSWDNIDLRKNIIKINQTLVMLKGKPQLCLSTKTKNSIRNIPIPKDIKILLSELKKTQKEKQISNEHNLVFINNDGSPYNPNNFSRNFKNLLKKLGFNNKLHLHSTRHTWATNMVQLGVPITDIQHLGGWSDCSILLDIYAHSVNKSQRRATNKLFKQYF